MKEQLQIYVKDIQKGDRRALRAFLMLLKKPLFAYLYRLSGSYEVAEDMLQESLLAIYSGIDGFDVTRPFLPWAYVVTKNKFLEFTRRKSKVVMLNEVLERKRQMMTTEFSEASEARLDLKSALDKIPVANKEAFILKHFQKLTFAEIANLQKIPIPTAKSRVLSALKKIRKYMQEKKL